MLVLLIVVSCSDNGEVPAQPGESFGTWSMYYRVPGWPDSLLLGKGEIKKTGDEFLLRFDIEAEATPSGWTEYRSEWRATSSGSVRMIFTAIEYWVEDGSPKTSNPLSIGTTFDENFTMYTTDVMEKRDVNNNLLGEWYIRAWKQR